MATQDKIKKLLADLPGAVELTPLELNDMRFSGRKTVITSLRLRRAVAGKSGGKESKKV